MAACFDFNGTDESIALADAAGYDVSPNGDSFTLSFWINPDTRTAEEVLFERASWFAVTLDVDNLLTIKMGDRLRKVRYISNSKKTHVMLSLKNATAIATGTADTNVASLLIDVDADWWTNGVNMTNDKRGKYIVYNRTDRTFGYGYVIPDITFTASSTTVAIATNIVTPGGVHGLTTGAPVVVSGTDVPAGLTSGNTYYVNAASTTTLKFYNTSANAITGGATGLVDLTDAGSGTVTLRSREDAIQLASDLCPDGNEAVMIFTEPWYATLRVWVNGVRQELDEQLDDFNTPADSAEVITVASTTAGASFYDGKMNEVAYWTPGFATDEIAAALYNDGTELEAFETYDGPMTLYGHWSFDENAASTAVDNDEGTAARDGVASGNTSTLYAATMDPTSYYVADNVIALTAATTLSGRYIIDKMVWDGSVTVADDLVVNDSGGAALWVVNNKVANDNIEIEFDDGFVADGIVLATIDAGTLYIYLR